MCSVYRKNVIDGDKKATRHTVQRIDAISSLWALEFAHNVVIAISLYSKLYTHIHICTHTQRGYYVRECCTKCDPRSGCIGGGSGRGAVGEVNV